MADYTIRLQGQDNLSNTIKNVRQEVGNLGKETTKLDSIQIGRASCRERV